jgi:hypothetical protein
LQPIVRNGDPDALDLKECAVPCFGVLPRRLHLSDWANFSQCRRPSETDYECKSFDRPIGNHLAVPLRFDRVIAMEGNLDGHIRHVNRLAGNFVRDGAEVSDSPKDLMLRLDCVSSKYA